MISNNRKGLDLQKTAYFYFPMKELPDWYGIPNIGFVYHGGWADSEVEYKGKRM